MADDDLDGRERLKKVREWGGERVWGTGRSLSGSSEDAVRDDERGGNSGEKIFPE